MFCQCLIQPFFFDPGSSTPTFSWTSVSAFLEPWAFVSTFCWNLELLFQHFVEPWTFVSTVASAFISTVANFKIGYFNVFWCKRVSVLAGFFCKNWEPLCPDEFLWKPGAHLLPCRQTWMLNLHQVQEDHLKGNRHARWRPEGVPRLKLAVPNVTFWIHKKL